MQMIPASISQPALAAQRADFAEAMAHQQEAVRAAWLWGLEEFRKRPAQKALAGEEASRAWARLAGSEPCQASPCPYPGGQRPGRAALARASALAVAPRPEAAAGGPLAAPPCGRSAGQRRARVLVGHARPRAPPVSASRL